MPSSASQKASRTTWVNGLPTIPTAAYLAAEGISPTSGPGREGKKRCAGAMMVWYASECAMKYGGDPPQPTSNHRTITAHQSILLLCPMQHRCIGQTAVLTAFSCGEQVPDVGLPHYRDARMQHSPMQCPSTLHSG